jgi:hypothetical protein
MAKKSSGSSNAPVSKAFEVGVREALNIFRGKKTPAEAASTVFNSMKRAQNQKSSSGKTSRA